MASTKEYDQVASDMRRPGTEQADGNLDARELIRHEPPRVSWRPFGLSAGR